MSTPVRAGGLLDSLELLAERAAEGHGRRLVSVTAEVDAIDPAAAAEVGLVRSVHEPDELLAAARALADRWTRGRSPVATALSRQMIYRNAAAPDPEQAHRVESLGIFYTSRDDGAEGISAFLDKRDPVFVDVASRMPPFYREWLSAT